MEKTTNGTAPRPDTKAPPAANGSGANGAAGVPKKKRQRSPSYPAINLEEALNRARVLYSHERKNAAALDVVVHHWGFAAKSSSGLLIAAAMKKFGLLIDVDGNNGRYVRLSPAALNILLDEREDDTDRRRLVREAALKPEIHRELWDQWGKELPSDATVRTYLVRDRDFTEPAAAAFIEEYKQTISFAGLFEDDTIPNPKGDDDANDSGAQMNSATDNPAAAAKAGKPVAPPPAAAGQKDFPLYLTNNQRAVLYVPATMTAKDYELLKRQIENHLMVIEATSVGEDDPAN